MIRAVHLAFYENYLNAHLAIGSGTSITSTVHVGRRNSEVTSPGQSQTAACGHIVVEPGPSGANPKHVPMSGPCPSGLGMELGHSQGTAPGWGPWVLMGG